VSFDILQILRPVPARPIVRVIDVGAMAYGKESYAPLRTAGIAKIVGFEPQEAECAKLNAAHAADGHTYLPYFIGDGSPRTFHLTRHAPSASVYEPDLALAAKFQQLGELYTVVSTQPVQTRRLDDIEQARPCDLLKIDTQGGELDVIRGGAETLRQALFVHAEVEFVPLYKRQPLFADIDAALRALGFSFHKFFSIAGRAFVPLTVNNDPNKRISQMLWADAVYVRDFMTFDTLEPEALLKIAIIAHLVYDAVDLAHFALAAHDRRSGSGALAEAYLRGLTRPA
jgi:FkbM family methyltransferase